MAKPVRIEGFDAQHALAVASLHARVLRESPLRGFGMHFLSRLYIAVASAPRSGVWVATDSAGRCIGFVSGCVDVGQCRRHVLRRGGVELLVAALPRLAQSDGLRQLLPLLRTRGGDAGLARAELLSVAVEPKLQGLGIGRRLVARLERAFGEWGHLGSYRAVTAESDVAGDDFYRRAGFRRCEELPSRRRRVTVYTKALIEEASAEAAAEMEA